MDYIIKEIKEVFAKRLRELRIQNGLSQNYMAEILDIIQSSYKQYESKQALPKYDKLIKISQYFEVSINYLLGLNEI